MWRMSIASGVLPCHLIPICALLTHCAEICRAVLCCAVQICEYHLKATSILKDGIPQRFCQQCGRFHPLEAFDGTRRSCRAMLQRHNARRAKKSNDTPVGSGPGMMMMGSGGLGTLPLSRLAGPASSGSPRRGKK